MEGLRTSVGRSSHGSRWSLALALAAGLSLSLSLPAQAAADSLDQFQFATTSFQPAPQMAQTFTARMTGQLDRVQLASDTLTFNGIVRLTVQIQSATEAGPSGTVLGTTSFLGTVTCCQQFNPFIFDPAVPVTAGKQYAIVVKVTSSAKLKWYDSGGFENYPDGQLYVGCLGCAWLTGAQYGLDFAFTTWVVVGNVNHAPSVAADNSTVTVNEGTAPANTGTFSDPDGDIVGIRASAGTVSKTGNSSGTWSWTQPASDEAPGQTITITADDGNALSATAIFTITVTGMAPTASISSAAVGLSAAAFSSSTPASSPEGTIVTLNGSASSPSAEDNAAPFTYSWTVTKNGTSFGSGNGAAFSFTPDDEGTFVATLQAKDDGGMTGLASVTIAGANVSPSVSSITQSAPLVVTAHESISFGSSFSDPGRLDSHTATWNFGDGATSTTSYGPGGSAVLSAAHSYGVAGTYPVTLKVTDDDGGIGQATANVTIQTTQVALSKMAGYVQNIGTLNAGQRNSLIAKLNAASASATRGDTTAMNNQLNAFLNELQADVNAGRISGPDSTTLRNAVHAVQAALGTYNRFLDWWPLGA